MTRPLVVVPARGGSKGIPGKNLREVGGLSLVARAVLAGRAFLDRAGLVDGAILVDTDDERIAAEGRAWGGDVPFLRPGDLAQDGTSSFDSVDHGCRRWEQLHGPTDAIILLQPTSPLRTPEDIAACWSRFSPPTPSVVSISRFEHPPEQAVRAAPDGRLEYAFGPPGGQRRQDLAPAWRVNGAVYVQTPGWLRAHRTFVVAGESLGVEMPLERSVDVDSPADLMVAEAFWTAGGPAASRRFVTLANNAAPDWAVLRARGVMGVVIDGYSPPGTGHDLAAAATRHGMAVACRVPEGAPGTPWPADVIPVLSVTKARDAAGRGLRQLREVWLEAEEPADLALVRIASGLAPARVTLVGRGAASSHRRLAGLAALLGMGMGAWAPSPHHEGTRRPDVVIDEGMELAQ